jgi:hypothetical protein
MSVKKVAVQNISSPSTFTEQEIELVRSTVASVLGEKVEVEVLDDGETIRIGNVSGIAVDENEVATIGGRRTRREFTLLKFVYDPGVRYYPDGSGEPPSEDCESVGASDPGIGHVLAKACAQHIENEVWDCLQARDEAEMAEEMQEVEQMLAEDSPS